MRGQGRDEEEAVRDNIWFWIGFNAFVLAMLALDLGVFHRRTHEVKLREALAWTGTWAALALLFGLGLWRFEGGGPALEYLTGYIIELSLSVDNIFVFALAFSYFRVPRRLQHRVLFWGILGALGMRAGMIFLGAALIRRFEFVIYLFGAFLVYTGVRMFRHRGPELNLKDNRVVRLAGRVMPVLQRYHGDKFFVRRQGILAATPLFVVLLVVEASDVMFALDSIPAIFGITREAFIVYTSNIFAILGLRSLYFALAGVIGLFRHLPTGLAAVLTFVGLKMLLSDVIHVPVWVALGVVVGILGISVAWSLLDRDGERQEGESRDFFEG